MKKIIIVLIGIIIVSCNQNKKENSTVEKLRTENMQESVNFDWLLGFWKRMEEEKGKETYENWIKKSETDYFGIGFTLQNNDTIKQERMELYQKNGKWNLTVTVPNEAESIVFEMTKHSENEFICVNNEIDFPNKIRYWKSGDRINATVSNSEINIPFEFEKLSK